MPAGYSSMVGLLLIHFKTPRSLYCSVSFPYRFANCDMIKAACGGTVIVEL
jgi:hypothetical protein